MIIKFKVSFKATGQGASSAQAEAAENLEELTTILSDAVQEWAEEFEGTHDEPDIDWEVFVELQ